MPKRNYQVQVYAWNGGPRLSRCVAIVEAPLLETLSDPTYPELSADEIIGVSTSSIIINQTEHYKHPEVHVLSKGDWQMLSEEEERSFFLREDEMKFILPDSES